LDRVLLFSLTAMANPTLIAVTTVMLLLRDPKRLMLGYLAGALLMSITLGLVIVFTLEGSGAVSTAKHTINPVADLALGALLIVVAIVIRSGRAQRVRERRKAHKAVATAKKPPRWRRTLDRGSPRATFVLGMLLTLPGASYLVALGSLSKLNYGTTVTVIVVIGINLIMLALIEVPLICFALAPDWTPAALDRTKAWFGRHGEKVAVGGAAGVGSLLVLRGVITLVS
jgi:Sap, sulfolipid-1-addressing protein